MSPSEPRSAPLRDDQSDSDQLLAAAGKRTKAAPPSSRAEDTPEDNRELVACPNCQKRFRLSQKKLNEVRAWPFVRGVCPNCRAALKITRDSAGRLGARVDGEAEPNVDGKTELRAAPGELTEGAVADAPVGTDSGQRPAAPRREKTPTSPRQSDSPRTERSASARATPGPTVGPTERRGTEVSHPTSRNSSDEEASEPASRLDDCQRDLEQSLRSLREEIRNFEWGTDKDLAKLKRQFGETVNQSHDMLQIVLKKVSTFTEGFEKVMAPSAQVTMLARRVQEQLQALNEASAAAHAAVQRAKHTIAAGAALPLPNETGDQREQPAAGALSPENFAELLNQYAAWMAQRCGEERRSEVVSRLPDLLDIVELELKEWKQANKESVPPEERQRVVEVLEKLFQRQEAWRQSVRLLRFPQPGDAFDQFKHDLHRTRPTEDPARYNTVVEVLRSGYRFDDVEAPLRTPRVIVLIPDHHDDAASP